MYSSRIYLHLRMKRKIPKGDTQQQCSNSRQSFVQPRGRTRCPARTLRSRTPSPTKNPTPQTYRTRNLYHAGVFVETLAELPTATDKKESQRNTQNVSLEGDWKFSLFGLVRKLSDPLAANLQFGMLILSQCVCEESSGTRTQRLAQTALPNFTLDDMATATAGFSEPVPYLPPSTESVAPTTTEAADPYHISAPKPDITVRLAHTGFGPWHQYCLVDHQASGSILSDPHSAYMGLRFPFLVAETKGSSANGTLVSAQNQAAVSGASMLVIHRDLNNQANWHTSSAPGSRPTIPQESSLPCFSVVTAGPTHEVYVHYMHQDTFYMHCIRSCRTTHRRDTQELVHFLVCILEWGTRDYKNAIVERLDKIPRCE
ncbi:hypothetical protein GQ44DRAFT_739505 [Phaeosphaeriaceae sp. PMI808]|nr:hypothetical protein GQ44DRAFT_739505 [Phaeosphaeriaceae sp. PMI808]